MMKTKIVLTLPPYYNAEIDYIAPPLNLIRLGTVVEDIADVSILDFCLDFYEEKMHNPDKKITSRVCHHYAKKILEYNPQIEAFSIKRTVQS